MAQNLIGPAEAAAYLNVPQATLYQWRYKGFGPRSVKVGRHVRYRPEDIDAWLNAQTARAS